MALASFPFHEFLAFLFCWRLNLKVDFAPHCGRWQWANEIKLHGGGVACVLHAQADVGAMEMTRAVGADLLFVGAELLPRSFRGRPCRGEGAGILAIFP